MLFSKLDHDVTTEWIFIISGIKCKRFCGMRKNKSKKTEYILADEREVKKLSSKVLKKRWGKLKTLSEKRE